MGGFLLLAAMIAIYAIIYWSIAIETYGDKNFGLLGFKEGSEGSTHNLKQTKNTYLPPKDDDDNAQQTKTSYKNTQGRSFLKSKDNKVSAYKRQGYKTSPTRIVKKPHQSSFLKNET